MWWSILPGILLGALIWFMAVKPYQLRQHERRRRSLGLDPKRKLPEDKKVEPVEDEGES